MVSSWSWPCREHQVGALEGDDRAELVGRGAGDLVELQTRGRAAGDGVQQLGLAAAQLHGLEEVGVVDRQRGRAADRFDRGDRVRREGPRAQGRADRPRRSRDPWRRAARRARPRSRSGAAPRSRRRRGGGSSSDESCTVVRPETASSTVAQLVERDACVPSHSATISPRFDAGHAEEIATRRAGRCRTPAAARDLAEAIGGRQQDVAQLERRRELQAGVVDDRQPATALVELPVERGVGHGLGGDLGQPLQERDAGELAGVAVVQRDQTDDLAAHDQRQVDARAVARFEQRWRAPRAFRPSAATAS